MRRPSTSRLAITVIVLILIVGGAGLYYYARRSSKPPPQNVLAQQSHHDPSTGVDIQYPQQIKEQPISAKDKKDKIILRLTEQEGGSPVLVTLRYESGLRVVASLTKAAIIDNLMRSSEKALPLRYTGYHQVSSRRYEHNGRNAGEFIFTYSSPVAGQRIKQRFVILVKDDDVAIYLAMQSQESSFDEQNGKVFDSVAASLGFQ